MPIAVTSGSGAAGGCLLRVNLSPLGAAAFASTGFKIDRQRTCQLLGFEGWWKTAWMLSPTRDFILEVLADLSIMMVNLSRLAEELVLWSTSEFGYLELDNLYASTSSIMPQKKNPDTAELARGKTGSVIGSLYRRSDHLQGPAHELQPRPAGGHASSVAGHGLGQEHGAHIGWLLLLS